MAANITQQVRSIVDPLIMKLRADLFNGNIYYPTLSDSLIPPGVITQGVQDGIDDAIETGHLLPSYTQFTAGGIVQTGKAVYFNGTAVLEADPANSAHAGKIIGIAATPGISGETVNIQTYGILTTEVYSFPSAGTVFLGTSGWPSLTIPEGSAFVQPLGISLSGQRVLILLSSHIYMI